MTLRSENECIHRASANDAHRRPAVWITPLLSSLSHSFRVLQVRARRLGFDLVELLDEHERTSSTRNTSVAGLELRGADLSGASLVGACLDDADFRGADLTGADLSGGCFEHADFRGAILVGVRWTNAGYADAKFDTGARP